MFLQCIAKMESLCSLQPPEVGRSNPCPKTAVLCGILFTSAFPTIAPSNMDVKSRGILAIGASVRRGEIDCGE
jgi:hypothetical protein